LISICRSAAQARLAIATDFVRGLRPEHLQSFWYSASKYCFAVIGTFIGLLWVTTSTREEAETYKEKLEEYRWSLRLSSKSAEFLDRAISMLTTSTGMLVKAIPENRPSETEGSISPNIDHADLANYEIENASALEDEEWTADHTSIDEMSMQASPTQFSDEAMEMLWPGFATTMQQDHHHAYTSPMSAQQQLQHQHNGFSMQPFLGIGGGEFEVSPAAAYQPHYSGSSGQANGASS